MTKYCCGCGIEMQNLSKDKEGYVLNLDNNICERCFKIKNYGEYKITNLNNLDYKQILDNIPKDSLIVYLTSLLNINFKYISNLKNVIIVLTKRDLLPKSIKDYKLKEYVKKNSPNYLDIEIISSIKNYNLDSLMTKIEKYSKNKPVYFVGTTNSGKSTLINKLIKNYSNNESNLTTSIYPSTTLNTIKTKLKNLTIVDTPGLINEGGIINNLNEKEIKKIIPRKEIKPKIYQLKGEGSLFIENYFRMDYYEDNNIVIYINNNLKVTKSSSSNSKLKLEKKYSFNLLANQDIVVEDLCFIKFTSKCKIDLYSSYNINIFNRDNLI